MQPQQNTGSFMSPTGSSADPIMEAISRRQTGVPPTSQSSLTQAPVPQSISNSAPSAIPQGQGSASVVGLPPQTKESELIIRALTDRLKTFSKIEEAQAIPPKPPETQGIGGI